MIPYNEPQREAQVQYRLHTKLVDVEVPNLKESRPVKGG